MRLNKEQLKDLKDKHGNLYSYSKYQTYINDPYGFYLKYIKHIQEDRINNNFSILGTLCHDLIEEGHKEKLNKEEMLNKFYENIMFMQTKFFNDNEKLNNSVEGKYLPCVEHYIKNFKVIPYEFKAEDMLSCMIDKYFVYGYVDMWHKEYDEDEKDTIYTITDFKTSTLYSKKDIESHKEQLLLYATGLSRKFKVPFNKIKLRWDFVKYVNVTFVQQNGKIRTQAVERHILCEFICKKVLKIATKLKYEEDDIDEMILHINNEQYELLPENIRNNFYIDNCYVYIEYSEKDITEFLDKFKAILAEIELNVALYDLTEDENIFWKDIEPNEAFYFNNLCGYSSKLHKPYEEYLKKHKQW